MSDAPPNYRTHDELAEQQRWDGEIERIAAYLYRDQHDWADTALWHNLSEGGREAYLRLARTVAGMCGFPYSARILDQLDRLCPCDPNPETTDGPQRECLLHGETAEVVTDLILLKRRVRELETKVPAGFLEALDEAPARVINYRDGNQRNNELANLKVVEHPEWDRTYAVGDPDPTPDLDQGYCTTSTVDWVSRLYTVCTWQKDHRGDHIAGDNAVILAVWPQEGA